MKKDFQLKIDLKQLPEGVTVTLLESKGPEGIDLEVTGIRIISPLKIKAEITKLQDTLDIEMALEAQAILRCSRCLNETGLVIRKKARLDYTIIIQDTVIDIGEDIRQELMLEYPLKPLCSSDCKGWCPQCGKDLNQEDCKCVSV